MTSLDVLGIPSGLALSPNSAVVTTDSYVILNLTFSDLVLPEWGNEKAKTMKEFGKRGCYKYIMGDEANSTVIRDLWHFGKIAVFEANDFPENAVLGHVVNTLEENPFNSTIFTKDDFLAAKSNGAEALDFSVHVVNPQKTDKFMKEHFNSRFYKKAQEQYKLPPVAAHFNGDAFTPDKSGFDEEEWVKDAKKGKEDVL